MQIEQEQGEGRRVRATMNARDSAAYIGCSYWKFLEGVKAKRIPHLKVGNRILCRRETLDAWMASQETASIRNEDDKAGYGTLRRLR